MRVRVCVRARARARGRVRVSVIFSRVQNVGWHVRTSRKRGSGRSSEREREDRVVRGGGAGKGDEALGGRAVD